MVEGMRLTEAEVDTLLSALVEKGYLRELAYSGGSRYKPRLASKRGSELSTDLWHALSDRTEEERRQS
ncbi:MAG TPA: hypothetical protein VHS06_07820 [Chloroflexota bacterium]|nr:hypothetical protein [Chloroflexota bacterium]